MPEPHREESIKLGDGPISTVIMFKNLGSRPMFVADGGSETDVNNRVKTAWAKSMIHLQNHSKARTDIWV